MHRDVAPNKMHDTKQKINLIIDAIVKANTNLTGRSAAALGKRTSKGRIASLEANYAAAKGRPAPEDLQLIGLPARTARSGHQKLIRMLEHCWRFSTKAGEDFGVSARHMGVVWCESCNVHDPVVLRRVGQKAHACFFILHWQGKVDTLWSWGCMTEFAHGTGLPKWLLRFEISWSKEEPAYTGGRRGLGAGGGEEGAL